MTQLERYGKFSVTVIAGYIFWLAVLLVRPMLFERTPDPQALLTELSGMRRTLEQGRAEEGGYPDGGGRWRIVALDPNGAFPESPAKLPTLEADAPLPPVCVLYKSDGKDYKLILHFEDKSLCRDVWKVSPKRVDLARLRYFQSAAPEGSWLVTAPEERRVAGALLRNEKNDPDRRASLRGICWACGFWTEGAALW